ncbi:hypothetical protein [Amycolatopsis sp. NPDC058986]|uniref:hypothetical protein n=1 Tax=unclassified Amycolatopsis TaxID=2618356 RepID=UPI0036700127
MGSDQQPEPDKLIGVVWADAVAAAGAFTTWYRGKDDRTGVPWEQVTRLVALALCRIAADQHVPIADAELDAQIIGYLRDPRRLLAEPLPTGATAPEVRDRRDPVLRRAGQVFGASHTLLSPGRQLGPTDDGAPLHDTVAERLVDLAQDQELDRLLPSPYAERLQQHLRTARTAYQSGTWRPSEAEVDLAGKAFDALRLPDESDVLGRSWLARIRRLAAAAASVRTTATTTAPGTPLGELLDAIAARLEDVAAPLPYLDTAWPDRPTTQRIPQWERHHIPLTLRARVADAERGLVDVVATLYYLGTGDDGIR